MPLVGLTDVESTGSSVSDDRICQIALVAFDLDTLVTRISYNRFINPEIHIPSKMTDIHGIADADVLTAPTFKTIAPTLAGVFSKLDYIVAHNGKGFDVPIFLHEFIRAGVTLTKFPTVFDTMLEGRWATADGKIPSLGELCWSLGVDYDKEKAHDALYDVLVMKDCLVEGIRTGDFVLPKLGA